MSLIFAACEQNPPSEKNTIRPWKKATKEGREVRKEHRKQAIKELDREKQVRASASTLPGGSVGELARVHQRQRPGHGSCDVVALCRSPNVGRRIDEAEEGLREDFLFGLCFVCFFFFLSSLFRKYGPTRGFQVPSHCPMGWGYEFDER